MKIKVTFTEDVEVHDFKGDVKFAAKEGETMDLEAPSAQRWIRRGKAIEGQPEKTERKPKTTKPKKDDKPSSGTDSETESDPTDA